MDLTPLFKAYLKTIKSRNKTDQQSSSISEKNQTNQQSQSTSEFLTRARKITSKITQLRDFLSEHAADYTYVNHSIEYEMTEEERDVVDAYAQRIIKYCSNLLDVFKNANELSAPPQTREIMNVVIDLIGTYLATVSEIYDDLKAIRVRRALERRKLSKLRRTKVNDSFVEQIYEFPDDEQFSPEELQMFKDQHIKMMEEFDRMNANRE